MNNLASDPNRKFVDPEKVLFQAGLNSGQVFADLGSGSGFYSMAAAKIVGEQGKVYSIDILESSLDHIAAEARLKKYHNIKTMVCDLEQPEACQGIPAGSIDLALIANITHQVKNRTNLFAEIYRLLKTGGKLLVIEWNDEASPIGPTASERVSEEEVIQAAKKATLKLAGKIKVDAYHYGCIFIK